MITVNLNLKKDSLKYSQIDHPKCHQKNYRKIHAFFKKNKFLNKNISKMSHKEEYNS